MAIETRKPTRRRDQEQRFRMRGERESAIADTGSESETLLTQRASTDATRKKRQRSESGFRPSSD
jgi:hypothetical protein